MTVAAWCVLALALPAAGGFAVYTAHRLWLMLRWRRCHARGPARPPAPARWPRVTVQLPLYNERFVAVRLLRAAAALAYPADRLTIQVLDDSTDETVALVAAEVARWRARGIGIAHLRRGGREGFKAGALAFGLRRAAGDLVAVFDADFVPDPDFLLRTVPYFADPRLGMVQARWSFCNERENFLTLAQGLALRAHFRIEHCVRNRTGRFFNFNGTAGVWRAAAIAGAGGWQGDTLTEDLDLSYRAQLRGWRFLYLDDVECPSELPATVGAFKVQQYRWMKGTLQVARKLLPTVLRAALPPAVKIEAALHLLAPLTYLLTLLAFLLLAAGLTLAPLPAAVRLAPGAVFGVSTLVIAAYYALAERGQAAWRGPGDFLWRWVALLVLGIGNSLNASRAIVTGLFGGPSPFVRTPKRGDLPGGARHRYRVRLDPLIVAETAMAILGLVLLARVAGGAWTLTPWLALFTAGWLYVVGRQLLDTVRRDG